jgi:hypothetical protein
MKTIKTRESVIVDTTPYTAYLKEHWLTLDEAENFNVQMRSAGDTRRATRIESPSFEIVYPDLSGEPTDRRRWKILDASATSDGQKYHQPKGSGAHLYFPLRARGDWKKIANDVSQGLTIAESEIKAIALTKAGYCALSIAGVYSWDVPEEWDQIKMKKGNKSRDVTILFDADWARPDGKIRGQIVALGDFLKERGAQVHVKLLFDLNGTGKTDVCDFLRLRGPKALETQVPCHAFDVELIQKWREEATGVRLPKFEITQVTKAWLTDPLPPREFVVDDILVREICAGLISEGGLGKSHLTLQLLVAVATGTPFLGFGTTKGRVVYVSFEDEVPEIRRRLYKTFQYMKTKAKFDGKPIDQAFNDIIKNVTIVSMVGEEMYLVSSKYGEVTQNEAVIEHIKKKLRGIGDIDLLVLDPFSRIHGGDENDNTLCTAVVNAVEKVKEEAVSGSVLILHHITKQATQNKDTSALAARGGSAIVNALRAVIRLVPASEADYKTVKVSDADKVMQRIHKLVFAKSNYTAKHDDIWLKRNDDGLLVRFEPERLTVEEQGATALGKLSVWFNKNPQPFSKRAVTQTLRAEIFGDAMKRKAAEEFFDASVVSGDLAERGRSGKGGGKKYVVAQRRTETREEAQDEQSPAN